LATWDLLQRRDDSQKAREPTPLTRSRLSANPNADGPWLPADVLLRVAGDTGDVAPDRESAPDATEGKKVRPLLPLPYGVQMQEKTRISQDVGSPAARKERWSCVLTQNRCSPEVLPGAFQQRMKALILQSAPFCRSGPGQNAIRTDSQPSTQPDTS